MSDGPHPGRAPFEILLVEDDDLSRPLVRFVLEQLGHQVVEAVGLADARRALSRSIPDLVVTDLVLPDAYDADVVGDLRAMCPDVPILVLSAHGANEPVVRQAVARPNVRFVPKPVELDDLERWVGDALKR